MRTRRLFLVLILLGLGFAGNALPAQAAAPSMLLDVEASGVNEADDAGVGGGMLSLGQLALVPVQEPGSGRELWVTDGTDAGTRPLLDLCPGPCSSGLDLLDAIGRVGIFLADSELSLLQPVLWRSDGTLPGTFVLTRSAEGGPERCSFEPVETAVIGSTLFFSGRTQGGCELWQTNGTVAGTRRLREITPADLGSHVLHDLTAVGGQVFFVAIDFDGWGLWRSDGTPEGTIRLHTWQTSERPQSLIAIGSRLFLAADNQGLEVWTSDGTPAGTRALTSFAPANPGLFLQEAGGRLYFVADDGTSGREMWVTDGTAAGTRQVTRFANANPLLGRVEKLGERLVFPANDSLSGLRLWTTDGRPESTAPLDRCSGGCPVLAPDFQMVRTGSKIVFPAVGGSSCWPDDPLPTDLWVSDGTGAGTRRIHDYCPCCRVTRMSAFLGKAFFAAGEHFTDYDLWASDGTVQGTRLLVPVEGRDNEILPYFPVVVGGRGLLAQVDDRPFTDAPKLWVTDGTPAGTEEVTSIGRNGVGSWPGDFARAGDEVLFSTSEGVFLSRGTPETTQEIPFSRGAPLAAGSAVLTWSESGAWRSDGTRLIPEGAGPLIAAAALDHRAVFVEERRPTGTSRYSLWFTDGTVEGTHEHALPASSFIAREGLVTDQGKAYFVATITQGFSTSPTLWVTNGTELGTGMLAPRGALPGEPLRLAWLGSADLFFIGDGGIWRTDGTGAGTYPITEGRTGEPIALATHGSALYFLAPALEGVRELGLWKSDGTAAGTVLLRSFSPLDSFDIEPAWFTSLGAFLYFVAEDERGRELWRTDGTAEGTVLVQDIVPGEESSQPEELTVLGNRLYFQAYDPEHGIELWEADGTPGGTGLVQDIAPGAFSSVPQHLTVAGGRLYFSADDGVHGREPWVYAPEGAACVPSDAVLCLSGGRFKVEADWRVDESSGRGHPVSLTADTGYFWFFDAANVEVIVKVLDGQGINGHHWVFYGALSNVEYSLTVTDTQTGAARRYTNVPGRLGSVADTEAFGPRGASAPGVVTVGPAPVAGEALLAARTAAATGTCTPGATRLCLQDGRFAVEARWKAQGQAGTGKAVPLAGGDTGYFWFFDASNVEVVLKVLDGRPLNGKFWVFYGALSDVEYTLTVTDTATGTVKTYTNPGGRLASVADTGAF